MGVIPSGEWDIQRWLNLRGSTGSRLDYYIVWVVVVAESSLEAAEARPACCNPVERVEPGAIQNGRGLLSGLYWHLGSMNFGKFRA